MLYFHQTTVNFLVQVAYYKMCLARSSLIVIWLVRLHEFALSSCILQSFGENDLREIHFGIQHISLVDFVSPYS